MATPVIVNAAAGPGHSSDCLQQVQAAFAAAGAEVRILPASNGSEIGELARKAAGEGAAVIVAAGGDGTLNAVASAVVGTGTALGILPLGTFNHFAKDLRIPLELEDAARTIVANHQVMVDVGEVNGRIFLNNSSIGLYPAIVRQRETLRKRLGRSKPQAMLWATMAVLRRHPFLDVRLRLGGKEQQRRSAFIFIGNNAYAMEGFEIGTRACLDNGCLSVYLAQRRGRWALLALAARALLGRLREAGDFEALTTSALRIETRHARLPVSTDGEVTVMELPLDYRARPRALRVIVPAPGSVQ
jgi:diacylglycerol kinase family enzyme